MILKKIKRKLQWWFRRTEYHKEIKESKYSATNVEFWTSMAEDGYDIVVSSDENFNFASEFLLELAKRCERWYGKRIDVPDMGLVSDCGTIDLFFEKYMHSLLINVSWEDKLISYVGGPHDSPTRPFGGTTDIKGKIEIEITMKFEFSMNTLVDYLCKHFGK
jgi:hypothetical protein